MSFNTSFYFFPPIVYHFIHGMDVDGQRGLVFSFVFYFMWLVLCWLPDLLTITAKTFYYYFHGKLEKSTRLECSGKTCSPRLLAFKKHFKTVWKNFRASHEGVAVLLFVKRDQSSYLSFWKTKYGTTWTQRE